MSINDFYKVQAYAFLLKSSTDNEDEIKIEELTISFVCSNPPQAVFSHLLEVRKYQMRTYTDGIIYFTSNDIMEIPILFIILEEVDKKYKWLTALTDNITEERLNTIVRDYIEEEKNEYKEAILDVVFRANFELIKKLKEDKHMNMSKEMKELFQPELENAKKERSMEIARTLLDLLDETTIAEKTGLSLIEIQQLTRAN